MTPPPCSPVSPPLAYPRFFRIRSYRVSSYKVFLCVGAYVGILAAAAVGACSGLAPLRLGTGLLAFAMVGMVGARVYHMAVNHRIYRRVGFSVRPRGLADGGWSVQGGLLAAPLSLLSDPVLGLPPGVFWDHAAVAIAVGGGFVRFGCVCNGCCVGRESERWFALRQHDVHGDRRRRIPAQWLEIAWWLIACVGLLWLWPRPLPPGSYALAVLGWYGLGRVWLEPLRARPNTLGGVRVDRVVGALTVLMAGAGLLWRSLGPTPLPFGP
jgi:phosphatidylglycerol---prolipoprotein diacylglyceryl transferase